MKIIFVSKNSNETYESVKHLLKLWNFLYWHNQDNHKESLLIVGNGKYGLDSGSHQNLLICAKNNGCDVPDYLMDGAGNLGFDGKVSGWKSSGFNVTTPEDLQSLILNALEATEKENQ